MAIDRWRSRKGLQWICALLLCTGPVFLFLSCNKREEPSITVVSFGGAYQAAQSQAYMKPFAAQTGIKVIEGDYNGDYGILYQRAIAPRGAWDVVSVEAAPTARGAKEGIFLEIPNAVYKGLNLLPQAKGKYAAGHLIFSTILAYSTMAFPNKDKAPKSWSDFWDVNKFPGKRALRNNPRGTLEIAILASGIDPAHLYPLDVDLAFRQLDKIRADLLFWESGAQPTQLLANGNVVMTSVYNGRVWDAKAKDGLAADWSWNQGLMETEYWAIPKNTSHPREALDFIAFSLATPQQAFFANEIAYGPTNLDALPLVKKKILEALPNSEKALPLQIPVNSQWWAENEASVGARWERWKNGK